MSARAGAAVRAWILGAAGSAIGALGALAGIGGGLFAVPLLHYGFGLALRRSVATSLALVLATATAATLAELAHSANALRLWLAAPLVAGAFVGAKLGYRVSKLVPERLLKLVFAVLLWLVALRVLLAPSGIVHPVADADFTAPWLVAAVAALGLLAGMVAPILGIGGGLVVVPGLLLLAPAAGALGARAASLAMSVPTAARSLLLYWREGSVDGASAPWLALGAFVGSVAGVALVHLDGMARAGQVVLCVVLLFTGLRFAADVVRSSRTSVARGPGVAKTEPEASEVERAG